MKIVFQFSLYFNTFPYYNNHNIITITNTYYTEICIGIVNRNINRTLFKRDRNVYILIIPLWLYGIVILRHLNST